MFVRVVFRTEDGNLLASKEHHCVHYAIVVDTQRIVFAPHVMPVIGDMNPSRHWPTTIAQQFEYMLMAALDRTNSKRCYCALTVCDAKMFHATNRYTT